MQFEKTKKTSSQLYFLFLTVGVVIAILNTIMHFSSNGGQTAQYILSLAFVAYLFINFKNRKYFNRLFPAFLTIILMLRYCITPMSYYITGTDGLIYLRDPYTEYAAQSIFLMVYELIAVAVVTLIGLKICYRDSDSDSIEKALSTSHNFKSGNVLITLAFLFVIVSYPQFLANILVFSFEDYSASETDSSVHGMYVILFRVGIAAIYCMVMSWLRRRKMPFFISAIWTVLAIWLASQGTAGRISRTQFLLNGVVMLSLLVRNYPSKKKTILLGGGLIVCLFLILGTMIRFGYSQDGFFFSIKNTLLSVLDYGILCPYYGGVENTSTALSMIDTYGESISLSTFINDVFFSFPFFGSRFFDLQNISPYYFNLAYHGMAGNVTQIIPMIGQGVLYLGPIFAPLFSVMTVCFGMFCERKRGKAADSFLYFLATMGVYYGATYSMYNINIVFTHLTNRMLPILIIVLLNKSYLTWKRRGA